VVVDVATCEFCRKEVEHNDKHCYFEIIGWEGQRKGGGTHAVHMRRRTGAVMHHGCMEKLKMGAKRGPVPDDALF